MQQTGEVTFPWLDEVRHEFTRSLAAGRVPHAILLAGPRGLGKIQLAREMSTLLLCRQQGSKACGNCRSCQLMVGGAHPDFRLLTFEMNAKTEKMRSELVIDQVRDLNAVMQLTHGISPRKLALIYPAEAMNRNTANALLKTLEEPPGDAVLLLVTHDPSRLSATIRSRCQTLHVRLPDPQVALRWLGESEGVDADQAAAALQASAGSPLVARTMLQGGHLEQYRRVEASLERVQAAEGAVAEALDLCSGLDQEQLWTWLSLISARDARRCFDTNREGTEVRGDQPASAPPAAPGRARQFLHLQSLADRNRRLLAAPLRKDLLLRDWLIQWGRLTGAG